MSQERYDAFFRFVEEFSPTAQKPETVPLEMIQYYRDSMKGILEKVPTLSTEMLVVTEIGELMKLMTEM